MVNPEKLYPHIPEDEVYITARQTADLTGESFNYIYIFGWIAENLPDFGSVIEWIAELIEGFGLPIHIDSEDIIPDDDWMDNMRYAQAPLFSESYEIMDPANGVGTGNFRPPYDFLGGANALVVTALIVAIGWFGGRHLVEKYRGKAAAGILATATSVMAGQKTKERFKTIFENFDGLDNTLAEGDIPSNLHSAVKLGLPSSSHMDILETINLLVNALDSNSNEDVRLLRDYIRTGNLVREPHRLTD